MDNGNTDDFLALVGRAVVECWGELPRDIQHKIYETAAHIRCNDDNELCREQLAIYFHNHHPRTERQVAMPEEIASPEASNLSPEVETELNSRSWADGRQGSVR